jgi:hypothetical protein
MYIYHASSAALPLRNDDMKKTKLKTNAPSPSPPPPQTTRERDGDGEKLQATETGKMKVWIRAYEDGRDNEAVERVEKVCEASASLYTDLKGDPLCRVRHFPSFSMLVKARNLFS